MLDRGDIVILATKGAYTGKPRPWVILQNSAFAGLDSVTVCLITTELVAHASMLRVDVKPTTRNGLTVDSQVQIDKIVTVPTTKINQTIGALEDVVLRDVSAAIAFFLDL
ncbi:type II toxin-antitoxin system PemK/MazF family toxin [Methylobacterium mesophilicum SR1.6/6]|uniref:Type II toxin-antitoxin system PemK/MazF family toxin n=1 Tax=Methylobacterium mesophilicum SR1.6/6 TaxID=908290 RepID=A0A6B9FUM8_9HYPH|nr:type II toxin-antitoxin system PemK/MazF family toxin [Methylobacterium mesophilicum]QGY05732.1 type II toxin-antitoxin system PemK/MazF family toxin [Methylobacterium mesophilicum SR1.6/6]